jgi:hypothetical protein
VGVAAPPVDAQGGYAASRVNLIHRADCCSFGHRRQKHERKGKGGKGFHQELHAGQINNKVIALDDSHNARFSP